ncbi:MAG: hypothetical protein E7233_00990 [Lachnospiraceae bacterium]|nr:hypothetical protein [Lachnospiraceae bacterium]
MAAEDKLKYFYDSAMNALKQKNEGEIETMRENLERDLENYKKEHGKEIDLQERLHRVEIKRELQKTLASEKLKVRRKLSEKEADLIEKLFDEVGEKLDAFRATPAYKDTLKDCINKIIEFADGEETIIYLCASDAALKDELEKECGVTLQISDMHFNGGVQADIPSRNIFINDSYSSIMGEKKRTYVLKA